jgi:Protein of unknown function (DUF2612)
MATNSPCIGTLAEAYNEGGYGSGGYGGVSTAGACYLSLLTSQYKGSNAPNLQAFLALLAQPFIDAALCAIGLGSAFNINPAIGPVAQGVQLDAVGTVIGASRILPFTPTSISSTLQNPITANSAAQPAYPNTPMIGLVVGAQMLVDTGVNQETVTVTYVYSFGTVFEAVFTKDHAINVPLAVVLSPILDDSDYLTLLQAKILQNNWDGQAGSLWQPWQVMFPGGRIYITDNQNMTCTIFLVGSFSPLQQQMIQNGLIVPRPEAVQYTYEFAMLPIFGFDNSNPTFISGFDQGNWS